jgi:2OG-Fe(II) oxygenase superfamily
MFLNTAMAEDTMKSSEVGDDNTGGLYIQSRNGECVHVKIPTDCCAFQIGETSQIMSGGKLQATPHAVLPPKSSASLSLSRESFAVFLEPEFDDPLTIPQGFSVEDCQGSNLADSLGLRPLKARWVPGQTFGDFHLATVSAFTTS